MEWTYKNRESTREDRVLERELGEGAGRVLLSLFCLGSVLVEGHWNKGQERSEKLGPGKKQGPDAYLLLPL